MLVVCKVLCGVLIAGMLAVASPSGAAGLDPALLAGLKARAIGPAAMSGRIAAIDAVASNPKIIYVGAATGGVWKSTDGGLTFKPIFDKEKVAAVGAVAVSPVNPDVVWVGTGEGNPRNSASVGWGVWKSLDGGETWKHLGLEKTERIHRIVLHPNNPDVAYVAALGQMWGENPERGVFKTTDGGATWQRVLFVNDRTGCADLVIDPKNPDKLFAAMWEYRRWPWFFRSGGPGSGLYVTHDGGATWKRLTDRDGLPKGELGRIGLGICREHPEVVYALVEAEKNTLLRSSDGGRSFKVASEGSRVGNRPFYYADIYVDPVWPNRVYDLATRLSVSDDGGVTFTNLAPFRSIHSDFHALWINPANPDHLIVGNDGGVAVSYTRGKTWRFVPNLPLGQYYHVNVDMDLPYNVYGGLQDNGSWRGPAAVWESGGIRNHHWQEVGFGDGFDVMPDPEDSLRGYSMSQGGNLRRWNLRTGEQKDIRPAGWPGVELRFNWNAALAQDPFDPGTIYYGSQFVHRSRDRGDSWEVISPDLTTNNPEWQKQRASGGLTPDVTAAENYTTLLTIAPSPLQRGVLWTGSDDGRIHLTRDGGATWVSVEKNLRGVPPNTYIPHIEASKHAAGRAYVVFDDHRRSNWTPYVYVTEDYGATWRSLASANLWGYCLVLEEDPVDANLLFLGTEFGLYVSQDRGRSWWRFTHGLPTVSVMDLVVHPREHDLVIATHGRSIFIVDDIRPLRSLTREVMGKPLHLFEIPPAQQYRQRQSAGARFPGDTEFRGDNRAYGALISFTVGDPSLPHPDPEVERLRPPTPSPTPSSTPGTGREGRRGRRGDDGPKATITVADAAGRTIRTFTHPLTQGLNRAVWDLRQDPFKEPPREEEAWWQEGGGPEVLPGRYTVTVKVGSQEASAPVEVLPDPRWPGSAADREANWQAVQRAGALQEALTEAIGRLREVKEDLEVVRRKGRGDSRDEENKEDSSALVRQAEAVGKRLEEVEKLLWVPPGTKGIVDLQDARSRVRRVLGSLQSSWDAPTPAQLAYLEEAEQVTRAAVESLNRLLAGEVAALREAAAAAGAALLAPRALAPPAPPAGPPAATAGNDR